MAKKDHGKELSLLEKYLFSIEKKDAKMPLLYPIFSKIFVNNMYVESDKNLTDVYFDGQSKFKVNSQSVRFFKNLHNADFTTHKYNLISIRKYAALNGDAVLLNQFAVMFNLVKVFNISMYIIFFWGVRVF